MFKDNRYINAGTIEVYRYGKKAREKALAYLEPHNGFVSFPVDGLKYWSVGTSNGKYGEFAKVGDTFISVNSAGYMWAKVGSEKATALVDFINALVSKMVELNNARVSALDDVDD